MKRLGMLFVFLLFFMTAVNANNVSPPIANANADGNQAKSLNEPQSNLSMNATNAEIVSIDSLSTFTQPSTLVVAVLQNLQNTTFNSIRVDFVKNAHLNLLSNLMRKNSQANDIKNLAEMPGGTDSFKSLVSLSKDTGIREGAIMLSKFITIANSQWQQKNKRSAEVQIDVNVKHQFIKVEGHIDALLNFTSDLKSSFEIFV